MADLIEITAQAKSVASLSDQRSSMADEQNLGLSGNQPFQGFCFTAAFRTLDQGQTRQQAGRRRLAISYLDVGSEKTGVCRCRWSMVAMTLKISMRLQGGALEVSEVDILREIDRPISARAGSAV